ncbi:hypothetical protein KJ782_06840, partial [Patescibacteria group bacterium]|nr:hypothetical protein [Patescibacteria group bacterium]
MKPSKELERVTKTAKVMLIVAFLCTFCIVGTRISQASWTPPSGAAPGGNTSAPLNVSSAYQTKQGSLNISGDKLMVSAGSMLFGSVSTDDRGIFWADTAEAEYPHVNYKSGQLFLSPGDTGTSTEIQGDLKIARLGPGLGTQGSITIDNPFNSQQLVLKVDDGANGAKINTVGSALNINTVGGRLFLNTSGTEAVHIGSTAEKAMICLNSVSDAILGDECIDEWSDIGSGGGYWSLTDNVIDPDVVYTTDLNHTVAIGRNNYFAEATALTVQSRGQDAFGIELVESDANNRIFSVKESATGHGELYLYNNAGNNTIVLDSSGGSYFAGNVGFGDWSPTSQLTVGNGDKFRVDSSGNVIRINDIAYSWPAVQGLANSYLRNDGSGNLSWVLGAGGGTDELVMVSAGETAGYLNDELVAGTDISLVEEDGGGGDMRMVVNYTGAGGGSGLWEGGSGTSINPVDPTGTLVGVGTNTPVSMFHVYGNNSWGSDISIDAQNVANGRRWMMISTGGDAGEGQGKFLIKDNVAGANRMVFDTTGKVGIGT